MKEWAKKWWALECQTSDVKKFFPELRHFRDMWKKGFWHWSTTSMILGRLPLNGCYVGQFDEENESGCCDCGLDKFETSDHFLFECPKYEHLRLGWRWSQVSLVEKRYRWVATQLFEMKSFLAKTGRFDTKLKTGDEGLKQMNEDKKKKDKKKEDLKKAEEK